MENMPNHVAATKNGQKMDQAKPTGFAHTLSHQLNHLNQISHVLLARPLCPLPQMKAAQPAPVPGTGPTALEDWKRRSHSADQSTDWDEVSGVSLSENTHPDE